MKTRCGRLDREIEHRCWDRSWVAPSSETIRDLAELGLLRTEGLPDGGVVFSLTMDGREEGAELFEPRPVLTDEPEPLAPQ